MPAPRSTKPLNLPDLSRLTLLVVDDNADSVEMLAAFLKACGARVLVARSAAGALAHVDAAPRLDAMVTDLAMPQMDGVELVRKVRARPDRTGLPVIALRRLRRRQRVRGVPAQAGRPRATVFGDHGLGAPPCVQVVFRSIQRRAQISALCFSEIRSPVCGT